jgi:hypothetical protein
MTGKRWIEAGKTPDAVAIADTAIALKEIPVA